VIAPGVIADHFSARYIFVPGAVTLGIAAILIGLRVPSIVGKTTARLDAKGAFVLSVGLVALFAGITEGNSWGWTSAPIVALLVVALGVMGSWVYLELRASEPMIDIRMLMKRNVFLTNVSVFGHSFAFFSVFIVVTTYVTTPRGVASGDASLVHYGFGETATVAGLFLVPGAILGVAVALVVGRLARPPKWPLLLGLAVTLAGGLSLLRWNASPWELILALALVLGAAPAVQGAQAHLIVDSVRPEETGAASGISYVSRMLASVIAGQIAAAILEANTITGTHGIPAKSAFTAVFWMCVAAAVAASVASAFVRTQKPNTLGT
jgi:hypothetical protein